FTKWHEQEKKGGQGIDRQDKCYHNFTELFTTDTEMILPIRSFGDPVLRKKGQDIDKDYPNLKELIQNMYETMYSAHGIGLAAPQIGLDIRLFCIDVSPLAEDEDYEDIAEELKDFRKVFINARILEESGPEWKFNEGCLSIPDVREDVKRKETIVIEYFNENFVKHTETFPIFVPVLYNTSMIILKEFSLPITCRRLRKNW